MGNRGRVEYELQIPEEWYFAGGAHFFQISVGGCPSNALPNCLRLDFQQPKATGFRVGVYNEGEDGGGVPVIRLYADRQVFWPDSFMRVEIEYAYAPSSGAVLVEITYTNTDHGVSQTVSGSATAAKNVDGMGRFVKWGRMHPTDDAGRRVTCWVRNDRYRRQ